MYEKFKQYKESTIYSMSNLELLLLLYDEAVKRLKMAQIALSLYCLNFSYMLSYPHQPPNCDR